MKNVIMYQFLHFRSEHIEKIVEHLHKVVQETCTKDDRVTEV